jgi:hypothetical protein
MTGNLNTTITLRSVRVTIVAVEKQYVLHTYSEFVSVALVIQHEMRMRRTVLSWLSRLALR